jgi:hypothetical protein
MCCLCPGLLPIEKTRVTGPLKKDCAEGQSVLWSAELSTPLKPRKQFLNFFVMFRVEHLTEPQRI